jgi:hypothetical protein
MNRRTVGYLAGWAAPNGGPLDALDGFAPGSCGDSVHIHAQGPASLHPVLGSSLGTDTIFGFGPNLKSLRLDARPARQVGTHRTAGPILQNEPTDGGVSGGVGRSQWRPPEAAESTLTASSCLSRIRGIQRATIWSG